MKPFLQKHADLVSGVLTGFDRFVFRGTLRQLCHPKGMKQYLNVKQVLLKEFGKHAEEMTQRIRAASEAFVRSRGRPSLYLPSAGTSKEDMARAIAEQDGVKAGLICMLKAIEPCYSYQVQGDRKTKRLRLTYTKRKCLHLYQYGIHPVFGFMHARIQTWFPFHIQICLNGREWLARSMDRSGLGYERVRNCFTELEDLEQAQELMTQQLRVSWPSLLTPLARSLNPDHETMLNPFRQEYYWSVYQSEVATDLMFHSPQALADLYPSLVMHGITTFQSPDVLRFLGHHRRTTNEGTGIRKNFSGEVNSSRRQRSEGIRVKHRVNGNSVKIYDKAGSVLRVETTINHPKDFTVYRAKEGDENGPRKWRPLRHGIADLARRYELSEASNRRYLSALGAIEQTMPLRKVVEPITTPVVEGERRFRALRPWSTDVEILQAVIRGEFNINGFRNRDIRSLLYPGSATPPERRRQMGAVSRRVRLLRAHGLITKVQKTHRYMLTNKGRRVITAVLAAREASVERLTQAA